jgi:hypothetical protein
VTNGSVVEFIVSVFLDCNKCWLFVSVNRTNRHSAQLHERCVNLGWIMLLENCPLLLRWSRKLKQSLADACGVGIKLAHHAGLEPATYDLERRCAIQLR